MTRPSVTMIAGMAVTCAAIYSDELLGSSRRAGERAAMRRGSAGKLESGFDRIVDTAFYAGLSMMAAGSPGALLGDCSTGRTNYRKVVQAWNASMLPS